MSESASHERADPTNGALTSGLRVAAAIAPTVRAPRAATRLPIVIVLTSTLLTPRHALLLQLGRSQQGRKCERRSGGKEWGAIGGVVTVKSVNYPVERGGSAKCASHAAKMQAGGKEREEAGATSRRRCVDTEACILNEPLLTEDRADVERDHTCAGLSLPREVQENRRGTQDSETWTDEVEQVDDERGCWLDKRGLARVFAIVNVMLGASMLIIPWAFAGSGLVVGTLMVFGVVSAEVPPA